NLVIIFSDFQSKAVLSKRVLEYQALLPMEVGFWYICSYSFKGTILDFLRILRSCLQRHRIDSIPILKVITK
ncbi:MAG: hypothetical protein LIP01_02750, partial [Tannerellaceae bacterium]|nr:hypothetical protein [Tannerellaceae bacterium]